MELPTTQVHTKGRNTSKIGVYSFLISSEIISFISYCYKNVQIEGVHYYTILVAGVRTIQEDVQIEESSILKGSTVSLFAAVFV